jgi:hypothetical protein
MPNRMLNDDELVLAKNLLNQIKLNLETLSNGDPELLFA